MQIRIIQKNEQYEQYELQMQKSFLCWTYWKTIDQSPKVKTIWATYPNMRKNILNNMFLP